MDPTALSIPARSERQAMDWSLVLASQEISSTIMRADETGGWYLAIEPHEYARAMAAIRQYQRENRGWSWQSRVPRTAVIFHWGSLLWCFCLAFFYAADDWSDGGLRAAGMVDSVAVRAGQWWRIFTAMTLHGNLGHLAANLSTGFILLGLAMARYGTGVSLLTTYLAGALGNVTGLLLYEYPYRGLGASGMVMGALGMISVQALAMRRTNRLANTYILSGLLAGLMLLVLLGLDPASDVIAHVGGFFAGCLWGGLQAWLPQRWVRHSDTNLFCFCVLSALVVAAWCKALL